MKLYEYNDAIAEAMNRAMQGTVDAETGELLLDDNGEPIIDFPKSKRWKVNTKKRFTRLPGITSK